MLVNNPEFKKNFLLEVNVERLGISFLIILLISAVLYDSNLSFADHTKEAREYAEKFFAAFCTIGFIFSIIWGTYLAANSVNEEARQKTWDFVRMSSLSPAKILIGKMFGATSLVWIVSVAVILPVLLVSGFYLLDPLTMLPANPKTGQNMAILRSPWVTISIFGLAILCWTIFSQCFALACSFSSLLSRSLHSKRSDIGITILTFIVGSSIGRAIVAGLEDFQRPGHPFDITWFGRNFHTLDITLVGIAFAAFWTLIAAHRILRRLLLFRDFPIVWVIFLTSLSLFCAGFVPQDIWKGFIIFSVGIGATTAYFIAFMEAPDIVRYQMLASKMARNEIDLFRFTPLWIVSFAFFALTGLIGIFCFGQAIPNAIMMLTISVFMARDLLVLHAFSWSSHFKRPTLAMFLYFLVVYALLPLLFGQISKPWAEFFFPNVPDEFLFNHTVREQSWPALYWPFQAVSLAIAFYFAHRSWKKSAP